MSKNIRTKNDDLQAMFEVKKEIEEIVNNLSLTSYRKLESDTISSTCQILTECLKIFKWAVGSSNSMAERLEIEIKKLLNNLQIEVCGAADKRVIEYCLKIKSLLEKWTSLYTE